jgi:hypothetical protein
MNLRKFCSEVVRFVKKTKPVDSDDIIWHRSDSGWHARLKRPSEEVIQQASGSGGGTPSIPARVKTKSGLYYVCDLYEDGIDSPVTLADQKVYVLQLNIAEDLSAITPKPWIMVSTSQIGETGGGNV